MLSWIFSTLLQSSVSHDPSEIKLICKFAVLLLSVLKTVVMLQIITMIHFFMTCWSQKSSIFCSIINAFTVTFNQFNASLLNKSKKKSYYISCDVYKCFCLYCGSMSCRQIQWDWAILRTDTAKETPIPTCRDPRDCSGTSQRRSLKMFCPF